MIIITTINNDSNNKNINSYNDQNHFHHYYHIYINSNDKLEAWNMIRSSMWRYHTYPPHRAPVGTHRAKGALCGSTQHAYEPSHSTYVQRLFGSACISVFTVRMRELLNRIFPIRICHMCEEFAQTFHSVWKFQTKTSPISKAFVTHVWHLRSVSILYVACLRIFHITWNIRHLWKILTF